MKKNITKFCKQCAITATILACTGYTDYATALVSTCDREDLLSTCLMGEQWCNEYPTTGQYICYTEIPNYTDCTCATSQVSAICLAGFYGDGTTCTECPSPGTSDQASESITDCCVSANTSMSDTSGTYVFTSTCCYSS